MAEEKAFKPTEEKIKKSRKKGNILKSQIVTQAIVSLTGSISALLILKLSWLKLKYLVQSAMTATITPEVLLRKGFLVVFLVNGTIILCCALSAVVVESFQVRGLFEPSLALAKYERIDFVKGLKKIFTNIKSSWLKLVGFIFLAVIGFKQVYSNFFELEELVYLSPSDYGSFFFSILLKLFSTLGICYLIIGGVEFLVNRKKYYRDLSMDYSEIKRENKEQDGDPYMKMHRKQMHESMLKENLVKQVRNSKCIIVEKA